MHDENVQAIHDGLWMAVNGAGTAVRARIAGRDVAGKTGTAQVISNQGKERARGSGKDLRDHGWFVFMVPRDNPELAGVIFAEHSEHGYLAAPIAKHIIETYYAEKEGRPLPEFPNPNAPKPNPPARAVAAAAADAGGSGNTRAAPHRAGAGLPQRAGGPEGGGR
jgi:penicillin-binding protein 2